jgi:DNA-binding NarL/FixJ family response regulator
MQTGEAGNGGRRTRIVVVDDHAAVRLGLERVLGREPGFRLVAALEHERQVRDLTAREPADVLVLDYELAKGDGLVLCQRLKQCEQPPAVLIYSAYAGAALQVPAAIAQADALVSKAEPVSVLLDAIRRIARGEHLIPPPSPDLLEAAIGRLDGADAPLASMLIQGATHREIAHALALHEQDVARRARRIVGRLRAAHGPRPTP